MNTLITLESIGDFLSKLAEKSESVYWFSSADFSKIIYLSPAYEEIWGRSRQELYDNPSVWITFLHLDDAKGHHPIESMREKVQHLGSAARFEENYRIVRPDGEIRWILDRGFPVYDDNGICCGVTGVAIDVTAEKQKEEALREAKEAAEAANRLKLDFIHNMEHDIRTPFHGVYGISNHLAEQEDEPEKKELLTDIANCAKELLDYCNEILDYSKIERGTLPVVEKKFNLHELIKGVITMENPPAKFKKLNLLYNIDENVPEIVIGDNYRIQRIIINLISNAIKFTKAGSVCLDVKFVTNKSERDIILQFIITDTGIGIPKEKQSIIYEKFSRIYPANKNIYHGHGLGLRIVKLFIDDLDADIEVESTIDVGTKFICTIAYRLPLVG